MKKGSIIVLLVGLLGFSYIGPNTNTGGVEPRAAGCTISTGALILQFNEVRARIETGGILWTERAVNRAAYEIPKTIDGSGADVIYAGSLWMGGTDVNGQLRLAATKFVGDGPDFWAGPLSTFGGNPGNYTPSSPQSAASNVIRAYGDAEIIPEECNKYDRFFTIERGVVQQFIAKWRCDNGLTAPDDCTNVPELSAENLQRIIEWPAHGDLSLGQDFYLAPFYDNPDAPEGANGRYDPITDGDYPWFDIEGQVSCRDDRRVTLFGDETNWWVFNDKGNIHLASGGDPIGMEIRAQAFSFVTNDEINQMTFYNYEMINRSTQTLFETYFAQYVDADVGGAFDDFVGCDVSRGLGFAYNGDLNDDAAGAGGAPTFGANPPAIGVDFFEGPYQDPDAGIVNYPGLPSGDNPLTESTPQGALEAFEFNGIPYEGLGLGYGDSIPDNERMGMRRFIYYNNAGGAVQGDPGNAAQFYGFMQGIWGTSGSPHTFGANGLSGSIPTNFMFPGDSDPAGWGTAARGQGAGASAGIEWSEEGAGNAPDDRRFAQVAGPFTLRPGAVNNLTVGVVYGRSFNGDLLASVNAMKVADTKAQSLFDACFEILEPPLAPAITIQEMENQLIIMLDGSAPGTEDYIEEDEINIPRVGPDGVAYDRFYRFQGYQIYQVKDATVSARDVEDETLARLVAQTDIEDGVTRLVNYEFNEADNVSNPVVKVRGADEGIKRSFLITEDLFAQGDRTLVNHKKYYYIAISYAYNQFLEYNPNSALGILGQKTPYLGSRRSSVRGEIETITAIPHNPTVEADGTSFGTNYGFQPRITQVEGYGNGGNILNLTQESINTILNSGRIDQPVYESGGGPINIKVIDPLNLKPGNYTVILEKEANQVRAAVNDTAEWIIIRDYEGVLDTIKSDFTIATSNEQLFPEWGLSLEIQQIAYGGGPLQANSFLTTPITSSIEFVDSSEIWLDGVRDSDNNYSTNWIRSGQNQPPDDDDPTCDPENWVFNPCYYYDFLVTDPAQEWEGLLNGTIAPFKYVGYEVYGMPMGSPGDNPATPANEGYYKIGTTTFRTVGAERFHDLDLVITNNKDLWTKCVVLEMNDNETQTVGGADILELREQTSVDKDGNPVADANDKGMGWFPGYAIDVTTGKRLNMAFGENSFLAGDNGNDMIWNPTSTLANSTGQPILGGFHYIYVFGNDLDMPVYDQGQYIKQQLSLKTNAGHGSVFNACSYIAAPLAIEFKDVLATDVTVKVRVNRPYAKRDDTQGSNNGFPRYTFSITDREGARFGVTDELQTGLEAINVVPNPYYAYSEYEQGRLDNRIKITNLPERCNVKIFNMQGSLIRQFEKDDPLTSVEWDLTNTQAIPIASGVYIIYVDVPGVGEKILKWFGTMRKVDLNNI